MLDIIKIYQKTFKKRCFGSGHCGHFKFNKLIKAEANLIVSALINLLNL